MSLFYTAFYLAALKRLELKLFSVGEAVIENAIYNILFDLDGTLLDGDSTTVWISDRLKTSRLKTVAALFVFPFIFPLLVFMPTRHWAAGIMIWLAAKGMTKGELFASFEDFAKTVKTGHPKLKWRSAGLSVLKQYQEAGHKVIIVTAAPEWLARALFDALNINVAVIGSTLKPVIGGWTGDERCNHDAKCSRLKAQGYGEAWAAAYSDSPDDIPLLLGAERPYVVNCESKSKVRKFEKYVPSYESVSW